MKIGKVPESVLKRSILRQLKTRRGEIIFGAGLGEDCAILAPGDGEVVLFSSDPVTGTGKMWHTTESTHQPMISRRQEESR